MSESDFSFSQDAVLITLYQPGVNDYEYQQWIYYEDIGYENISILQ